eukprot:TRINITY_DN17222_c0_g1_i7.p1 TRINITY_DN17222_c0_g1~~TRINITY_DN17222_c0_g1_i7.p1  ORF type:complete len:778 (+),score=163.59 TRINITY_DN17222_c0_g1_i7:140-2473(+)
MARRPIAVCLLSLLPAGAVALASDRQQGAVRDAQHAAAADHRTEAAQLEVDAAGTVLAATGGRQGKFFRRDAAQSADELRPDRQADSRSNVLQGAGQQPLDGAASYLLAGHFEDAGDEWVLSGDAYIHKWGSGSDGGGGPQMAAVRFARDCAKGGVFSGGAIASRRVETAPGAKYVLTFQASYSPERAHREGGMASGFASLDGLKRPFLTSAQCRHSGSSGAGAWDTFKMEFVATAQTTELAFGEDLPDQCVAVREVLLMRVDERVEQEDGGDEEKSERWKSKASLAAALQLVGCHNSDADSLQESVLERLRTTESDAAEQMFAICEAARNQLASEEEREACCGLEAAACEPGPCKAIRQIMPEQAGHGTWARWLNLTAVLAEQSTSQDENSTARFGIDGHIPKNPGSLGRGRCSITAERKGEEESWEATLPMVADVIAVRVSSGIAGLVNPFSVYLDNRRCGGDLLMGDFETKEIPCIGTGRRIRIRKQRSLSSFSLCELQVKVGGSVGASDERGCPLQLQSFAWQGTGDLAIGYLAERGQYFESRQVVERPASVYAEIRSLSDQVQDSCVRVGLYGASRGGKGSYALEWSDEAVEVNEASAAGAAPGGDPPGGDWQLVSLLGSRALEASERGYSCFPTKLQTQPLVLTKTRSVFIVASVDIAESVGSSDIVLVVNGKRERVAYQTADAGPAENDENENAEAAERRKKSILLAWAGDLPAGEHQVEIQVIDPKNFQKPCRELNLALCPSPHRRARLEPDRRRDRRRCNGLLAGEDW